MSCISVHNEGLAGGCSGDYNGDINLISIMGTTTASAPKSLLLRFRAKDSPSGMSKESWNKVASALGMSETEALHHAMVQFAAKQGVKVKTIAKVRPVKLEGMDMKPLSKLMAKHDPEWEPSA